MCKVFLISGIKKKNLSNTWDFINAIKDPMSKFNKDGLGYAAITAKGSVFGERWFTNSDAFQETIEDIPLGDLSTLVDEKSNYTTVAGEYNSFGTVDRDSAVAITLHTRMATSPKVMSNTHPFVENDITLIHNGVIRNVQDFELRQSTCDSEAILMEYVDNKVNEDISAVNAAMSNLKGYYACGVLAKDSKATPIMDVFKSDSARLCMTYVNELENWVFTTEDSDVTEACNALGFTHGKVYMVKARKLNRFNAITGKLIESVDFEPASEFQPRVISNVIDATNNNREVIIYPHDKRKNIHIEKDMLEYYKSGKPSVSKLSDLEIQEHILSMERNYGAW